MLYHSTNYKSPEVDFARAILQGQASDKGLFMPNDIPKLKRTFISSLKRYSFQDIALKILDHTIGGAIPYKKLKQIILQALNFEIPIERFGANDYMCFLDRGPTSSFKDFGARILARLLEYVLEREKKTIIILTATSGDTGGAVAQAFYKMDNIKVIILYPKNEVSNLQRKQMTTLGGNVTAIGIDGKFDDCQRLVKRAFADSELKYINLSSANSINFGRLLPQSIYYFYSYSRVVDSIGEEVIFSVPSGNFGNLTGGLLAKKMGLPIKQFIVAVNENDEFPKFLDTGIYRKVVPSKKCISNAMNVGHPSNLARIVDLYGGHIDENGQIIKMPHLNSMRKNIVSYSISDTETRQMIVNFYDKFNQIIEPHGAVGWAALQKYRNRFPNSSKIKAINFETADPAKFPDEIHALVNIEPSIPKSFKEILNKKEHLNHEIINTYRDFKVFLHNKYIE
ncbi:MAG: threonine synthase [Promethearchaeota archaeon]|nr:MAG: threonine synthase [Candidatus Lokiarchaeota archaeon]